MWKWIDLIELVANKQRYRSGISWLAVIKSLVMFLTHYWILDGFCLRSVVKRVSVDASLLQGPRFLRTFSTRGFPSGFFQFLPTSQKHAIKYLDNYPKVLKIVPCLAFPLPTWDSARDKLCTQGLPDKLMTGSAFWIDMKTFLSHLSIRDSDTMVGIHSKNVILFQTIHLSE